MTQQAKRIRIDTSSNTGDVDSYVSWVHPDMQPCCVCVVEARNGVSANAHSMMEARTTNPKSYEKEASCNLCGMLNLPMLGQPFYHCSTCSWDVCGRCVATSVRLSLHGNGQSIEVLQDMSAAIAASLGKGLSSWAWRVWTCGLILARHLNLQCEEMGAAISSQERPVALELGAGSALASLVLAKQGTHRVILTDQRQALPLTRDSVRRNFPDAIIVQQESLDLINDNDFVLQCPAHHGILSEARDPAVFTSAESRCSVCSRPLCARQRLRCTECGFSVCHECAGCVHRKDLGALPRWFQVQCQWPPGVVGEAFAIEGDSNSSEIDIMVWPLDWTQKTDVGMLQNAASARKLPPPSLIVASDVSYDGQLVKPLLETLVTIRDDWIRSTGLGSKAEMLFCQERRGTGVDVSFLEGLQACGITVKRIPVHQAEHRFDGFSTEVELFKATL